MPFFAASAKLAGMRSSPCRYLGRLLLACLLCTRAAATDSTVKIYVAASTRDVVAEIAKQFTQSSGVGVEVSPGPSSKLAKQIVEGGPADLFLSADQANADYLGEKQLVARRRNLLGNRLVVVVPKASTLKLESLADLKSEAVQEVALALEKVPAGEYARQALGATGVWNEIQSKVIGGEDVRATLAFVERGAAAGIVYATDARGSSQVRVAFEIDPGLHQPIEYPLVLLKRDPANAAAQQLYDYLGTERAAEVFRRSGFRVIPE